MVCATLKPSLRLASCCKVDVVKGACGNLSESFLSASTSLKSRIFLISKYIFHFLSFCDLRLSSCIPRVARIFLSSISSFIFFHFPEILRSSALKFTPSTSKRTFNFQLSSGLKSIISLSLSTISFTATDCTLQADNHFLIFFQRTGLVLNQTILSNNLLDC